MRKRVVSALAALAGVAGVAAAQPSAPPDAAAPSVPVAKPAYQSVFTDYRPWTEATPGGWRAANDEVGRLRGHVGHVEPLAEPRTTATPPKREAK
jgi:ABC-type sugar transport system substrate-binding protein